MCSKKYFFFQSRKRGVEKSFVIPHHLFTFLINAQHEKFSLYIQISQKLYTTYKYKPLC